MIVVGPIANFIRGGRPTRSASLFSDLAGNTGTKELLGFGVEIGLKAAWLQGSNDAHEHFDLVGQKIETAIAAGAVRVDRRRLIAIIAEKRGYYERRMAA